MALLTKGTTTEKASKDDDNRGRNMGLGFEGNKLIGKLAQKKTEEKSIGSKPVNNQA